VVWANARKNARSVKFNVEICLNFAGESESYIELDLQEKNSFLVGMVHIENNNIVAIHCLLESRLRLKRIPSF
jgi:hypothetical protein